MDTNRENLLREIMASDFTVLDLHLYLDTHPCDQKAIQMHNTCVQRSKMLRDNYEKLYGPLSGFGSAGRTPWPWINSPWPWEKQ